MTDRPGSDWLGKRLRDRYEIRQELGKAIGRRTLLADDLQVQRLVVIKVITFGGDFEWANLRLFEREGEVLKSLDHAGIPDYLDYFEIDSPQIKGYALVQSYVAGQSLQAHLQAGRTFSEADVIDIAQRLLEILQYLHSQMPPIIHRDLKPSNILLSDRSGHSQGRLYLVDFGAVQAPFLNPAGTLTIVGAYGYMPPEQFGGRAEPASDLYSLGATLIYLVTGHHPADLPQQNFRIRFEAKANHISYPLRQWLRWLTAPEIAQRPASAPEALKGLRALQHTGSLSELPSSQLSRSRILINQRQDRLNIIVLPKGFRPRQASSWLSLLVFIVTFSIASAIAGELIGFIAVLLLPLPASNSLFRQLHLRLDQHDLTIYRETGVLARLRRVLFKAKRAEIERIVWGEDQNTLEICGFSYRYCLNRQQLGLTMTDFKLLAHELRDGLGVPLISEISP